MANIKKYFASLPSDKSRINKLKPLRVVAYADICNIFLCKVYDDNNDHDHDHSVAFEGINLALKVQEVEKIKMKEMIDTVNISNLLYDISNDHFLFCVDCFSTFGHMRLLSKDDEYTNLSFSMEDDLQCNPHNSNNEEVVPMICTIMEYIPRTCLEVFKEIRRYNVHLISDFKVYIMMEVAKTLKLIQNAGYDFEHNDLHTENLLMREKTDENSLKNPYCRYNSNFTSLTPVFIDFEFARIKPIRPTKRIKTSNNVNIDSNEFIGHCLNNVEEDQIQTYNIPNIGDPYRSWYDLSFLYKYLNRFDNTPTQFDIFFFVHGIDYMRNCRPRSCLIPFDVDHFINFATRSDIYQIYVLIQAYFGCY